MIIYDDNLSCRSLSQEKRNIYIYIFYLFFWKKDRCHVFCERFKTWFFEWKSPLTICFVYAWSFLGPKNHWIWAWRSTRHYCSIYIPAPQCCHHFVKLIPRRSIIFDEKKYFKKIQQYLHHNIYTTGGEAVINVANVDQRLRIDRDLQNLMKDYNHQLTSTLCVAFSTPVMTVYQHLINSDFVRAAYSGICISSTSAVCAGSAFHLQVQSIARSVSSSPSTVYQPFSKGLSWTNGKPKPHYHTPSHCHGINFPHRLCHRKNLNYLRSWDALLSSARPSRYWRPYRHWTARGQSSWEDTCVSPCRQPWSSSPSKDQSCLRALLLLVWWQGPYLVWVSWPTDKC